MTMDGQDVTEMVGLRTNLRFEFQTKRDGRRFERAWFADFRERWQRDLRAAREQFKSRMEGV